MDALILSRIQFASTLSFHFIYPPLIIGLGMVLVIMEALWLKTGNSLYLQMARFWTKVFALTFALGVATGIMLPFQFGTNWAEFSRFIGDVFGSVLAAEGIFAFFLEAGFLAVMLFGWNKVGRKFHFFSTCMVCFGAHFSLFWIVVANSLMHTPAGFHIVETPLGPRAEVTDYWAMIFNPSAMESVLHVLWGCWQAGAFLVVSVSAWYLIKKKHVEFAKASMRVGLGVGLVAAILSLVSGHASAVGVSKNQPAKFAAFEGLYQTTNYAPMVLFGWVDEKNERAVGPAIPGLLSFLVHGDASKPVTGLNEFKPEDRPPVQPVFQLYRLMVGIGFTMIGLALLGTWLCWRKTLFEKRWVLWPMVFSVIGPQIANQAGWYVAEIGRQPWIVHGLMRTSEGVSPGVTVGEVLTSLMLFTFINLLLFALFIYLLNEKIQHGPDAADLTPAGKLAPLPPQQPEGRAEA